MSQGSALSGSPSPVSGSPHDPSLSAGFSAPIRPAALRPGSLVGICAPSGSLSDPERLPKAVAALESLGFRVRASSGSAESYGYLAGSDELRAREFTELFEDPDIEGIFCLKGGYGTPRILDRIDWARIAAHPKVFVGYSDITALHIALQRYCGFATFHGPMPSSDMLPALDAFSAESLLRAVFGTAPLGEVGNTPGRETECLVPGVAEGPLVGGNLSLVAATTGTPWQIDARGAILFLEDIDEAPYRIDRMLTQLRLAGILDACAGFVFGDWKNCAPGEGKKSLSLREVFADILPKGKPVLANLGAGHCDPKVTLPLGVRVRLDAGTRSLRYIESATSLPIA